MAGKVTPLRAATRPTVGKVTLLQGPMKLVDCHPHREQCSGTMSVVFQFKTNRLNGLKHYFYDVFDDRSVFGYDSGTTVSYKLRLHQHMYHIAIQK